MEGELFKEEVSGFRWASSTDETWKAQHFEIRDQTLRCHRQGQPPHELSLRGASIINPKHARKGYPHAFRLNVPEAPTSTLSKWVLAAGDSETNAEVRGLLPQHMLL